MRWFSSDLHLGHDNIRKFCNRPFRDTDSMNARICRTFQERVGPDDELWLLGDIAMGSLESTLPLVRSLTAGRIVLVAGNHDRVHLMYGAKGDRFTSQYARVCDGMFTSVAPDLALSDGTTVKVSHFPYSLSPEEVRVRRDGVAAATDRFAEWRPIDNGSWLLCGHVHDAWRQRGRQVNVGVDAWGGAPVSEEDLVRLIAAGPTDRPPLPWQAVRPPVP